jgi:hypothetical protein
MTMAERHAARRLSFHNQGEVGRRANAADLRRSSTRGNDLMRKIAHDHHAPFRAADVYLPIVTLGFFGLRRFRPHWLYAVTALLLLCAWIGIAYFAGTMQPGTQYLVAPLVFVMAIVTFLRLVPPASSRTARIP